MISFLKFYIHIKQSLPISNSLKLILAASAVSSNSNSSTHHFLSPNNEDGFEDFEPPLMVVRPDAVKSEDFQSKINADGKVTSVKSKKNASKEIEEEEEESLGDQSVEDPYSTDEDIEEILSESSDEDWGKNKKKSTNSKNNTTSAAKNRKNIQNLDGHWSSSSFSSDDSEVEEDGIIMAISKIQNSKRNSFITNKAAKSLISFEINVNSYACNDFKSNLHCMCENHKCQAK